MECANCIFNFNDQRDIRSVFVELSLPWAENVETQVALRYEDYEDIGSALSPKVALSWRPVEELLLRASWSESFRAPNIGVVNQAFEANGTSIQDPLRNQGVRAGLLPAIDANAVHQSQSRTYQHTFIAPKHIDMNPLVKNLNSFIKQM